MAHGDLNRSGEGIMFRTFRIRGNIQIQSQQYIRDNEDSIRSVNQRMLVLITILYSIVVAAYLYLSTNVFREWHVTNIYLTAFLINIPVLIFVLARYLRRDRSYAEVNAVSTVIVLYVMTFVCVISVSPANMSPAVYFSPILIAFSTIFIHSWNQTVFINFFACVEMVLFSLTENQDIFNINLFSTILTLLLDLYLLRVLYDHRISENMTFQKLQELGMYDKLTGLYNKASTEMKCRETIEADPAEQSALMILDFDNFKTVNDTFGHQQGDQVLMEFGRVLREASRPGDIVGRIGGDEFLLFLSHINSREEVVTIADRINENTREILSNEMIFSFSCSIGICIKESSKNYSYERMFSYADRALYQVKEHGKNGKEFFSEEMLGQGTYNSVLIIDTLKISKAVIVSCLEDDFHPIDTDSAEEASSIVDQQHGMISAVVIDIERPPAGLDEFLQKLSRDARMKSTPVFVFRTHLQGENIRDYGLKIIYIEKPFDPNEVRRRIIREADELQ